MKKKISILSLVLCLALFFSISAGFGESVTTSGNATPLAALPEDSGNTATSEPMKLGAGEIPTSSEAAVYVALMPEASGKVVYGNSKVKIDASNTASGYAMVSFIGNAKGKLKVLIKGPSGTQYTYNLKQDGTYEVFPLSDGDGRYTLGVYENISGTMYSTTYSRQISVNLTDQFAPFLMPNQYVNFTTSSSAVAMATSLSKGKTTDLKKVEAIYTYVIDNLTYDRQRAATVQSGYLPDIDSVLAEKKGICFDYASLMTAMLRSQGIPTKLVVGYTGKMYHAWINAYTAETGWIDGVIYFDGRNWKLMDPTFASGSKSSSSIMTYINNGENYTAKYLY